MVENVLGKLFSAPFSQLVYSPEVFIPSKWEESGALAQSSHNGSEGERGLFLGQLSLRSLWCSKAILDILCSLSCRIFPYFLETLPNSLQEWKSSLLIHTPDPKALSVKCSRKEESGWAPAGMWPPQPFPVWEGGGARWGPPIQTDQASTLWKLVAKLRTLSEEAPHHLIYNPGNSKTDMGGMESLLTIWLQVANFKEMKFLTNDINQLESRLNQAQAPKWRLQVLIRCSDLNKGNASNTGPWDPWILACPEGSRVLHTIQVALVCLLMVKEVFTNDEPWSPFCDNLARFVCSLPCGILLPCLARAHYQRTCGKELRLGITHDPKAFARLIFQMSMFNSTQNLELPLKFFLPSL